jgi:hypothetical protein
MSFLLRTAFWLTVVIFFIPVDESAMPDPAIVEGGESVGAGEAAAAAQAALQDMSGFCGRNPGVCDVGGKLAHTFALKARTGALWLYSTLDEQLGGSGEAPAVAGQVPAEGSDTLTSADLQPAWNGPDAEGEDDAGI